LEKRKAVIIGLIGGILMLVGLFLDWFMYSSPLNGIDFLQVGERGLFVGPALLVEMWEGKIVGVMVLVGGILSLVGCILALISVIFNKSVKIFKRSVKIKVLSYLILIGGILAIVGGAWGYAKVGQVIRRCGFGIPGLGLYLVIAGALIVLKASLDLRSED
jgi:hypothetical protein